MKTLYKADLHVHSSYSNKPTYWALRKFNCPESYTSPQFIYATAREMGMDYVTITDHNTITGALEIAHLPGAFVSVEMTSYFPEDSCKIHVVVLNITESIFRDLMGIRKNVYEMIGLPAAERNRPLSCPSALCPERKADRRPHRENGPPVRYLRGEERLPVTSL